MPELINGTKIWHRTKADFKDLDHWMAKGRTVYTVLQMATNLAPYEDDEAYTDHTCTGRHVLLGNWMFGGTVSIERLLFEYGPVHQAPPAGLRFLGAPVPQVGGPLPKGKEHGRKLTAKEIAYLEALASEADARSGATKRSKQALGNRWF
ncbi:hypothetical protein [Streptomyces sp. NPDC093225]|uniref:hypothetical protein n=1 Tax=Streptomyces sp. NPDC093225 TaxID=3366034 RepID=UPI003822C292